MPVSFRQRDMPPSLDFLREGWTLDFAELSLNVQIPCDSSKKGMSWKIGGGEAAGLWSLHQTLFLC